MNTVSYSLSDAIKINSDFRTNLITYRVPISPIMFNTDFGEKNQECNPELISQLSLWIIKYMLNLYKTTCVFIKEIKHN